MKWVRYPGGLINAMHIVNITIHQNESTKDFYAVAQMHIEGSLYKHEIFVPDSVKHALHQESAQKNLWTWLNGSWMN